MKLNLQILYDNLSKSLSVSLSGIVKQELFLERPRFLTASSKSLQSGCCYVVRAEKLPQRLPANPGAALVCIGNSPYLPYYREHCTATPYSTSSRRSTTNLIPGMRDSTRF